jgi:hypothetical protein
MLKVPQVLEVVAFQIQSDSLVVRETGEHLIKYVVILLVGQGTNDPRLVQEVAVDLGSV